MQRHIPLTKSIQVLFIFICVFFSGCTSSSHSDPSRYNLHFQAYPQINESSPLKVQVLLLKSDADFMSSDFYSLQNNTSVTLGANLLNRDVFFLMPGQLSKTLSGQISPGVRYIGVMAEYKMLDRKKWRVSLPLPALDENHIYQFWKLSTNEFQAKVFLDENGIRVISQ